MDTVCESKPVIWDGTKYIDDDAFIESSEGFHEFTESLVHDREGLYLPYQPTTEFQFSTAWRFLNPGGFIGDPHADFRLVIEGPIIVTGPGPSAGTPPGFYDGAFGPSLLISGGVNKITAASFNSVDPDNPDVYWNFPQGGAWNCDWSVAESYLYSFPAFYPQPHPPVNVNGPVWLLAGKYAGSPSDGPYCKANIYLIGWAGSKVLLCTMTNGVVTNSQIDAQGHFDTTVLLPGEVYWTVRFELTNAVLDFNVAEDTALVFGATKIT